MKLIVWAIFLPMLAHAQIKSENFVVQINDRSINVISPEKRKVIFSVLVENKSLSDQLGKFTVEGKNLKFVTVRAGETRAVEIENKTLANVVFIPVSPAFQEVELLFGKKAYEIPSKE